MDTTEPLALGPGSSDYLPSITSFIFISPFHSPQGQRILNY